MTNSPKARFCESLLSTVDRQLGFIDVGSGGSLKHPWSFLPAARIHKYDIDPEITGGERPVCISDRSGPASFRIAGDPRGSSLHEPSEAFIRRFENPLLRTARTIEVELRSLSEVYGHLENAIDMIDVNVEGHDFQVLRGADMLFSRNFIKLLKVEYELTEVWRGQGWFSDIDATMRARGFDLAAMENELARPAVVANLRAPGEPIWGKALYVPSPAAWRERAASVPAAVFRVDCLVGIALYAAADLAARALELAQIAQEFRASAHELSSVPDRPTLYRELETVFGTRRGRQVAKLVAQFMPSSFRERLRPLVRRLLNG